MNASEMIGRLQEENQVLRERNADLERENAALRQLISEMGEQFTGLQGELAASEERMVELEQKSKGPPGAANPIFGQQPPCDDGKHRFMAEIKPGVWGVWVMEQIGPKLFREKTAFKGTQEYVTSVKDKCGPKNRAWWGHAYGG